MKRIESHPGIPLVKHLLNVANRCEQILLQRQLTIVDLPKSILIMLAYIAGAVHDIGKATKAFQYYLETKDSKGIDKTHSLISAFFAFFIAKKCIEKQSDLDVELRNLLPYLVFVAVKRHHGNLTDFSNEIGTIIIKKEELVKQIDDFFKEETIQLVNEVLAPKNLDFDWVKFVEFIKEENNYFAFQEYSEEYTNLDTPDKLTGIRNFYIYQILYSTLLQADKSDVILENAIQEEQKIDFDAVSKYRIDKKWNNPSKNIDIKKNEAFNNALNQLNECFNVNQHLYSVTLPTGLGKTVTSFALALLMKKLLKNPAARIVITIPFTSIIDQNYEVYSEVLKNPPSSVILKHHHLSEPKYKENEEDDVRNEDESKFLIESWQSQVVVTTFVQLFECIFTNNKSKLLKLPNLTNAIIILDEVQNVPFELWESIRQAFFFLAAQFNCYFILMSATQPLIFEPKKEIIELVPDYKSYFKYFNRTKLINKTQNIIPLDDFVIDVIDYHKKFSKRSILIILNKVETTRLCFEKIVKIIPKKDANLYYLSTQITPYERKAIIHRIKHPKNGKPNIIISTQLIEAGVDISVHTVFRAFASLDSIIQAAGRANRYWKLSVDPNTSEVFLYKIKELQEANKWIYGGTLLSKTEKVLKGIIEIEEKNYLELIETYFKGIKKHSQQVKNELIDNMQVLEFEKIGAFKWIQERQTESVFVQLNDEAVDVWNQYKQLYEVEMKPFERKKEFARFKATFYDYVVNVPIPKGKLAIEFDSEPELNFYLAQKDKPSINYSFQFNKLDFRKGLGYLSKKQITFND